MTGPCIHCSPNFGNLIFMQLSITYVEFALLERDSMPTRGIQVLCWGTDKTLKAYWQSRQPLYPASTFPRGTLTAFAMHTDRPLLWM